MSAGESIGRDMAKTSIELAQETADALASNPGSRPVVRLDGDNIRVTKSDHSTLVIEFTDGPYADADVEAMRTTLMKDHGLDSKRRW